MEEHLRLLIQEAEGYKTEFKESLSDLDKELVAFANASGGTILLGVRDDGTIKGIEIDNRLKSQVQDIARNCDPPVPIALKESDNILMIVVKEGKNKPYACSKGFYLRVGPNSQKLSRDAILQFAIDEGIVRYDEMENPKFTFDDFHRERFGDFLKRTRITVNLEDAELLGNLDLAEKSGNRLFFKNAAVLFFARNLRRFNPSAYTTCLLYGGNDRTYIVDRKDFDGNLIEQVEDAVRFVEQNTLLTYQIKTLTRKEIPQYPMEAVREGILNAVVHRDYFERGSNAYVHVYRDFIEVINPGGLFKIKPEDFGKTSSRRNERIADLFRMIGWMEKAGTGIKRMRDAMLKQGLKEPKFDISEYFFIATFYGHTRETLEGIAQGAEAVALNERQKRAVEYVEANEFITNTIYTQINHVHRNTASKELVDLVNKKIFIQKGKGRGSQFELKK